MGRKHSIRRILRRPSTRRYSRKNTKMVPKILSREHAIEACDDICEWLDTVRNWMNIPDTEDHMFFNDLDKAQKMLLAVAMSIGKNFGEGK